MTVPEAVAVVERLRATGKTVVFTNIVEKKILDDQLKGELDAVVKDFAASFAARKAAAA